MTFNALLRKGRWQNRLENLFFKWRLPAEIHHSERYLVFATTEEMARTGASLLYSATVRVVRSYRIPRRWGDTKVRFIYWIVAVEGLDLQGVVRRGTIALPNLTPQAIAQHLPAIMAGVFARSKVAS